jgi:hypothetical protein
LRHGPLIYRREFLVAALGSFPFFWRRRTLRFGDVRFRILRDRGGSRRYIHIHGNEATARQVLLEHRRRGNAYVVESDERNVPLLNGEVDPNRIFSREGASRNLQKLNTAWSQATQQAALDRLERDRQRFINAITPPSSGLLVALHNNGPGYSAADELPISDSCAMNDAEHPDEFILCTDAADFGILARSPFNVLLQNQGPVEDDGSLSRLAARMNFRYINIEAAHGNVAMQTAMLAFVENALP